MVLLVLIKKFRYSLGGLGSLHWSLDGWEVFSKYLRVNLARQIQFRKDKSIKTLIRVSDFCKKHKRTQQQINQLESTEEEGFLNLVEKGKENFEMLTEVVNRIIEEIDDLSNYACNITEKINKINTSNREQTLKKLKRLRNQGSARFESFNKRIESEIPLIQMHFSTAIDSYGKAAILLSDFDTDIDQDVLEALDIVNEIKKFTADTREDMGSFRQTVASCSYVTTRFYRAKRKSVEVLDDIDKELKSGIMLINEVENLMRNLLE